MQYSPKHENTLKYVNFIYPLFLKTCVGKVTMIFFPVVGLICKTRQRQKGLNRVAKIDSKRASLCPLRYNWRL